MVGNSIAADRPASLFGVVVIGRNEGARLESCLASAVGANEVIYVDSGSTDDSLSIARKCNADVVELDMSVPFTAARARNAGFARLLELSNDLRYVQFVDGDCELVEGWTEAAVRFLDEHPEVAAVCGRRTERNAEASVFNKMCDHEWNTPVGEAKACGGESLVRIDAFQAVGGFRDEQIAHEEPELCGRLRAKGHKIWRIDQPMSLHDAAITRISQFYARSRRAGFGLAQYIVHSRRRDPGNGGEILVRALCWALFLPIATIAGLYVFGPGALSLLFLYPLQLLRYTIRLSRTDYSLPEAATVALLTMLGKFAETQGAIEFAGRKLLGKKLKPILYR